ncbi:two-component system response regulator [Alteromonas oceani]|uniref:Two-component system response regulator n=1 Tax=Alteromonas oceani TaxID=2071609 RepID=A0ABV7JU05_9ALTE|nr:response regulator [Alteromonas oceani]
MNAKRAEILVVESPGSELHGMVKSLENEFFVEEVSSGQRALEIVREKDKSPCVVLIETALEDTSGYQVCEQLKQQPGAEHTDVILMNNEASLSDKLKGYDAGASDFITGKAAPEEVVRKIKLAASRDWQLEQAEAEKQAAMDTAMTAIVNAGEQASIIHFMRESFKCESVNSLAQLIVETAAGFGLSTSVQIETPTGTVSATSNGNISPLETQLLTTFQKVGRIHQRGQRLILSYGMISQLIKNMPVDDDDKCGRFRDHFAVILEGAVSRLKALFILQELDEVLVETNESLASLSDLQSRQKKKNVDIMARMQEDILNNFFNYGLTEEQEKVLLTIIEGYSDEIFRVYEEGMTTDSKLSSIAQRIQQATQQNS